MTVNRVRAVPRRLPSALKKFFQGVTDPEVVHLTKIERVAVLPGTKAHDVSELQEFANFVQVPTVANIAAPELDTALAEYLESLMTLGQHSSKDMKLLPAVLPVCSWMEKQSRMGPPRACVD